MGKSDISTSDSEEESENESQNTEDILSHLVGDMSEYKVMEQPGPNSLHQLTYNTELYMISIPKGLFDPMKLIHTELVVGGSKERGVKVGSEEYQIATYPVTPQTQPPPLFLPNKRGNLCKVDDDMLKGHIVFRSQPQPKEGVEQIDIRSLCSKQHVPPSDLRPRNFFTSKPKGAARKSIGKEGKAKKRKREEEEEQVQLPQVKKKKKKKNTNVNTSLPLPTTNVYEEETQTLKKKDKKLASPFKEEVMSLSQGEKKGKRSEKVKKNIESDLDSPNEEECLTLSQKMKKGKKTEKEELENLSQGGKKMNKEKKVKFSAAPNKDEGSGDEKGYGSDDLFAESPKKKKNKKKKLNLTV